MLSKAASASAFLNTILDCDIPAKPASDLERGKPSGPVWTREVVSKRDARMPVIASWMRNKVLKYIGTNTLLHTSGKNSSAI